MARAQSWLLLILGFGVLVLGYVALRQRASIARAVRESAGAESAAHRQLAEMQRQVAGAEDARVQVEKAASLLQQGAGASGADQGGVLTIHISDILKDHPEYAALMVRDRRRHVLRSNGAGLAGLKLPPEKLAKLKDLLVERTFSSDDAQEEARAAGLLPGSPAWRAAIKQAADGVNGEIAVLLGADSQAIQRELERQNSASTSIGFTYAPDLDDAGVPLSAEQVGGLQQAVAESSGHADSLSPAERQDYYQPDPTTGLSIGNERLLAAAAPALSPAQMEVLRTGMIRQNRQTAIFRQYMRPGAGGVSIVP